MRRRVALTTAALAVLAGSVTTAVAVTATDDDDRFGRPVGMMWSADRGQGPMPGGSMMPGPMHRSVEDEHGYLTEMVAHHEEAVAAARELARSERAQMRDFGRQVVVTQSAQIEQMQRWLAAWYPNRPTETDYEPMMRDLTGLTGDRLDRAFLTDMIWHHMGAVMMSQQLLMRDVADHRQVETLARTIRDEQHDEVFQMQQWLHDWFGEDWGPGRHHGMW